MSPVLLSRNTELTAQAGLGRQTHHQCNPSNGASHPHHFRQPLGADAAVPLSFVFSSGGSQHPLVSAPQPQVRLVDRLPNRLECFPATTAFMASRCYQPPPIQLPVQQDKMAVPSVQANPHHGGVCVEEGSLRSPTFIPAVPEADHPSQPQTLTPRFQTAQLALLPSHPTLHVSRVKPVLESELVPPSDPPPLVRIIYGGPARPGRPPAWSRVVVAGRLVGIQPGGVVMGSLAWGTPAHVLPGPSSQDR